VTTLGFASLRAAQERGLLVIVTTLSFASLRAAQERGLR
jgi:hypothetical protein